MDVFSKISYILKNMETLLKIISGGNLPREHRDLEKISKIKSTKEKTRVIFRFFLIHPVKRRAAKYYLAVLQKFFGLKVVGITGSAGKTTTKEMLTSILREKGKTVASFKNIDPVYNIPSTILKCTPFTKFLVLELGIEFPGEMDFYLWLAKPDIGVITNIYPTHLELFKDVDGVFNEKRRLLSGLQKKSYVVLNKQDRYLQTLKPIKNVIWFGKGGDLRAAITRLSVKKTLFNLKYKDEQIEAAIPIYGKQFVENALAASAAAIALGFNLPTVSAGLSKFKSAEHRMNILSLPAGIRIFDDSYNNNPQAAMASIGSFMEIDSSRKKIIVFGDMLELGKEENKFHEEIGNFIAKLKPDVLICVGEKSNYTAKAAAKTLNDVYFESDFKKIKAIVKKHIKGDTDILIKGSRSLHLDQLVPVLQLGYNF